MEGNFEDEEEVLFGDELDLFDDELDDDDTLFEEIFADGEMVWSHELPSTSFGDLEALASNVPALSEAGSFKKNGFEGDIHVEFSDKGLHNFFVEQVGPITLSRNSF